MRQADNVRQIASFRPEMMGFIFYQKSARFVTDSMAKPAMDALPSGIDRVGVFVNEKPETVIETCKRFGLDYAQLHGAESPSECRAIRAEQVKVIKAIPVSEAIAFDYMRTYEPDVDLFLFDTQTANHGGSGKHFDWKLLKKYPLNTPYLLSGGIGPSDIETIKNFDLPQLCGIDANSRLEIAPGLKDPGAVEVLISEIRKT